jgi:sterol 3beta-glucosyltransferase
MVAEMVRHVRPLAQTAFHTVRRATADADLIVHSFLMTDAGHTLARMQGVPEVSAQFFPVFLTTAAFPSVVLPDLPLGAPYRRVTQALTTAIFRYGSRLLYSGLRASDPDLPKLASWPFAGAQDRRVPILFAFSRHVLPRPSDWPSNAHVTGYWQLRPCRDWSPPNDLLHFLESGPPPIYFGPGSMRTERLQELTSMVAAAVRARGERLVLGASTRALGGSGSDPGVFLSEGVPHAWLFPRMRYIMHHGGAGTVGAAAAAGVPSTGVPFSADLAFWSRRILLLGLGPASPPAQRLTRGRLEAILEEALGERHYARRARLLGGRIRQEEGVGAAVRVIQSQLGRGKRQD